MSYTPDEILRPDSVKSENFMVCCAGQPVNVENAVYYPDKNSVELILNGDFSSLPVTVSPDGVTDITGNAVENTYTGYARMAQAIEYDVVHVSKLGFYQNGLPVQTLKDKVGVTVKLTLANTSSVSYKDGCLKLTDKYDKLILFTKTDIDNYCTKEIELSLDNYLFYDNYINLTFTGTP